MRGSGDPLPIVHLALAGGLALFAAVAFGLVGPLGRADGSAHRWVWLAAALVAAVAPGFAVARLAPPDSGPERRMALAIVIWALAEAQALLGLVLYLFVGDVMPAAAGLLLFLFLWWRYRPSALRG